MEHYNMLNYLFQRWRAALAESISTAFLLFSIIGCVIAFLNSHVAEPSLLVPLAVFINLFPCMTMIPITGGHMNPFVTFTALPEGITSLVRALVYMLAQCMGSIMGFFLINTVLSDDLAHKTLLGGCALNGLSPGEAFMLEFTCTFLVLLVGVTVAFDREWAKELGLAMVCVIMSGPMAVGVYISITLTGNVGYSGVGLNPARCLGPAIFEGGPLWQAHWVFWVGPFSACVVYYLFFKTFPKNGLAWVGENDVLEKAGNCFREN